MPTIQASLRVSDQIDSSSACLFQKVQQLLFQRLHSDFGGGNWLGSRHDDAVTLFGQVVFDTIVIIEKAEVFVCPCEAMNKGRWKTCRLQKALVNADEFDLQCDIAGIPTTVNRDSISTIFTPCFFGNCSS